MKPEDLFGISESAKGIAAMMENAKKQAEQMQNMMAPAMASMAFIDDMKKQADKLKDMMGPPIHEQFAHLLTPKFDYKPPELRMPDIDFSDSPKFKPAKFFVKNIKSMIEQVEAGLADDEFMLLILSVDGTPYIVDMIGHVDPSLVVFECEDLDGNNQMWMMNHEAVEFLIKCQKVDADKPEKRKRIGFHTED